MVDYIVYKIVTSEIVSSNVQYGQKHITETQQQRLKNYFLFASFVSFAKPNIQIICGHCNERHF